MKPLMSNCKTTEARPCTKLGLVAVVAILACTGQAKADDPVQTEIWKHQQAINDLLTRRVEALERRVALLERRTPTAYQPGSPPPSVTPSYYPAYLPPSYATSRPSLPTVPPCPLPAIYK